MTQTKRFCFSQLYNKKLPLRLQSNYYIIRVQLFSMNFPYGDTGWTKREAN